MVKNSSRRLCALLTETAPIRRLPMTVVRQLVRYYGDWRHSRDILNDVVEIAGRSQSRLLRSTAQAAGPMNSYRTQ